MWASILVNKYRIQASLEVDLYLFTSGCDEIRRKYQTNPVNKGKESKEKQNLYHWRNESTLHHLSPMQYTVYIQYILYMQENSI